MSNIVSEGPFLAAAVHKMIQLKDVNGQLEMGGLDETLVPWGTLFSEKPMLVTQIL